MTDTPSPALSVAELATLLVVYADAGDAINGRSILRRTDARQAAAALRELADTRKALEEARVKIAKLDPLADMRCPHGFFPWDGCSACAAARHSQTEQKP